MMLSKADFEELFPTTFGAEDDRVAPPVALQPSLASIARWEDDGGRTAPWLQNAPPALSMCQRPYSQPMHPAGRTRGRPRALDEQRVESVR